MIGGIALIASLIGIYQFFHEERPRLTFEVINESNVLDLHKSIDDLNITFQGQNIEQSNLNLKIFTLKIENAGKVDILQNFYDKDSAWGFNVSDGKIIDKIRIIQSNSDYLQKSLNPFISDSFVNLNKVIFERNKFIVLEVLILHDKNVFPKIEPLGKIAGIDKIDLTYNLIQSGEKSFPRKIFDGGILVQLTRVLLFWLVLIIALIALAFFLDKLGDYRKRKKEEKRKDIVDKFIGGRRGMREGNKEILFEIYIEKGIEGVARII